MLLVRHCGGVHAHDRVATFDHAPRDEREEGIEHLAELLPASLQLAVELEAPPARGVVAGSTNREGRRTRTVVSRRNREPGKRGRDHGKCLGVGFDIEPKAAGDARRT